jgi:hypothetical protein
VKASKLQTYRGQFKQLKMKEDEDIIGYFLRVDETINAIIGLGEEIKKYIIVQKVLRSLPMRFNPKISTLEERSDLNSISMDELHGIFTAYEMRTEQENPEIKEVAFKACKRSKQKKKEQEEYSRNNDVSEDDEEVANFVKRLNKGTNGRYRGKLPLICFNCDGIILITNVLIRKREMMKVTQKANKYIKVKELQRMFSRKKIAPNKTSHHQMKMKLVIVKHREFYLWQ